MMVVQPWSTAIFYILVHKLLAEIELFHIGFCVFIHFGKLYYEELAAVCAGSCVCHRKRAPEIMQVSAELIRERLSPYALTACACACRVSALYHEVLDYPVEYYSVVITLLC